MITRTTEEEEYIVPVGELIFEISIIKYSQFLKDHFHPVYFAKTLYIYDEAKNIYREAGNEIQTHIRDTFVKFRLAMKLTDLLREVMAHMCSMGGYAEYPFDRDTSMIPVRNGIISIDYTTGSVTLLPHDPCHLFTFKLDVNYDPAIPKCKVMKLLHQWVDTEEDVLVLLQAPAQGLLQMQNGEPKRKAYLLQGEPRAGKTSYITLNNKTFGIKNISSVSLHQICDNKFATGSMEGKILNIFDELQDVALNSIEPFKALTGNCVYNVERKYKQGYSGRMTAVHIFSCNYPPEYPERVKRDPAFWERWEYVKFPNSFPMNLKFYEETFTDEMFSSYLNAIIWAMIQINRNGLMVNSNVQTVMEMWNINSDHLYEFLKWGFHNGDGKTIDRYSKTQMHHEYLLYCRDKNVPEYKRKMTLTAFTQSLQPHGIYPVRHMENNVRFEVYETTKYHLNRDAISSLDYRTDVPVLGIPISNAGTLGV